MLNSRQIGDHILWLPTEDSQQQAAAVSVPHNSPVDSTAQQSAAFAILGTAAVTSASF
jgi:hypothetical protein